MLTVKLLDFDFCVALLHYLKPGLNVRFKGNSITNYIPAKVVCGGAFFKFCLRCRIFFVIKQQLYLKFPGCEC